MRYLSILQEDVRCVGHARLSLKAQGGKGKRTILERGFTNKLLYHVKDVDLPFE